MVVVVEEVDVVVMLMVLVVENVDVVEASSGKTLINVKRDRWQHRVGSDRVRGQRTILGQTHFLSVCRCCGKNSSSGPDGQESMVEQHDEKNATKASRRKLWQSSSVDDGEVTEWKV